MGWGEQWFESDRNYPFYSRVIRVLQPRKYVEFGTHLGFSLISALEGCSMISEIAWSDAETYIPESNRLCAENVRSYLDSVGRSVSIQYTGRVEDVQALAADAPLLRAFKDADVLYVDGDHRYDAALRDVRFAALLGTKIILVDDCLSDGDPHLRYAVAEYSREVGYPYCVIPSYNGLAIFDFSELPDVSSLRIGAALETEGLPVYYREVGMPAHGS